MVTKQRPDRKVIRLQGYDYSLPGNYFVTIVTQDRLCLFGKVEQFEMRTNVAGHTVEQVLTEIPEIYSNTMVSHCVVMPNHIHFIITLLGGVSLSEIIRRFKSYTTHLYIEGVKNSGWARFNRKLWQPTTMSISYETSMNTTILQLISLTTLLDGTRMLLPMA